MKYEILEHTADLKIKAYGKNLAELFINAALGMASQQSDERPAKTKEWEILELESDDLNSLLVDWLNEILYRSDVNNKVYLDFRIEELSESPARIKAQINGISVKEKNIDIKAATYHGLDIIKKDGYCKVIIIFDI